MKGEKKVAGPKLSFSTYMWILFLSLLSSIPSSSSFYSSIPSSSSFYSSIPSSSSFYSSKEGIEE